MTDKLNFTKILLEELPLPEGRKDAYYWDSKTRGLCIRVRSTGTKTFYVRRKVQGKSEKLRLGRFPELTVEQARTKATAFHSSLESGKKVDDARQFKRGEITLGELFDQYIENHGKKRLKTWEIMQKDFERNFADWKKRNLSSITRSDVEKKHSSIGETRGHYAANRALEVIRSLYNRAIAWELFNKNNPAVGITEYPEHKRIRILQADEFAAFFDALDEDDNEDFKDFVKMSLFTGARKSNVLAMKWKDIDFRSQTWTISGTETKNMEPHTIALTDAEMEILDRRRDENKEGEFVFPGPGASGHYADPKNAWKSLLDRADIKNFHLHDLRRSMASWMANTGANISLIQSALNHKDMKTTLTVYAHTVKEAERNARQKAHDFILGRESKTDRD